MHQPERTAHQFLPDNNRLGPEENAPEQDQVRSLTRQPGSPSSMFAGGEPMQLQAAPGEKQNAAPGNAPMQLTPSKEVPDLDETVVNKVNAFLKAGKKQEAINEIMKALVAKDPALFDLSKLDGGKVHHTYAASAHAAYGPKTKTWLQGMLAKGPADIKTDKKAMRKYLDTLTIPAKELQFHVEISDNFCNNSANLYSSIRHEFVHVKQKIDSPFKYLSTSEIGTGWANPSTDYQQGFNEFEAYGWEADNLKGTGLDQRPNDVWNVYKQLAKNGPSSTDKVNHKKWEDRLDKLWETAFTGLLTRAEAAVVLAKKGTLDASGQKQLDDDHYQLKDLWGYKSYRTAIAAKYKARFEAINSYYEGKEFAAKMKEAETKIKSAKKGYDAYNVWSPLFKKWINLSPAVQATHKAEYTRIMPGIWTAAFDMILATAEKLHKEDAKGWKRAVDDYLWEAGNMLLNTDKSMVDAKVKAAKQKELDAMKKKLGR